MSEIELKLLVTADDLPKARDALLAMAGRPRPQRSKLSTTYFDTADDALRRNELLLRVRRKGRQFVQTVKAGMATGDEMLERGEWEDTVRTAEPNLEAPQSGERVRDVIADNMLVPLFTTTVDRTTFTLRLRPGTEIEVAIDRGEITAEGVAAQSLHEVELELKRGEPVVLWDVALRLLDIVPCRVGTRSKSERGYDLARGTRRPAVYHEHRAVLAPKMLLDSALQAGGRALIAMILRNEEAARAGMPEGVHQMRVATRRLRAILSAMRSMLPDEHFRWANDELRWLGGALAPARNWDVFAESLLEPVSGMLARRREFDPLALVAERRRRIAHERAREAIASTRYTATIMRLSRWFEARGWRDQPVTKKSARLVVPLGKVVPGLLSRLHRKAMKRARRYDSLDPGERHKLRIALKKLRYTSEFLGGLYGRKKLSRYVRRLKPLQDDLGHENDLHSARALVAELGEAGALERAGGVVLGWHDRGLADAAPKLRAHVRRFRRSKKFW